MVLAFDVRVGDLNWLFLVYAVAVVVVILFYLFYFGRLFAGIISLILRTILWRRYKVWIDIGSLQFSPLGGRLLFRDLRYVGENQSISIVMGHITWRYWLWRVRQDEDLRREDTKLPCRTAIKVEGAEWFIYNRNPAFDMLLERLGHREADALGGKHRDGNHDKDSVRILPPSNESHSPKDPEAIDWFREALPLEINVLKGAIVMGNRSTPSLIVAGFRSAVGTCGAVKSRSELDFYKQVYQFSFTKPRILFRKNHDYESSLIEHGKRMRQQKVESMGSDPRPASQSLHRTAFQELLRRWPDFAKTIHNPFRRPKKVKDAVPEWHGLARYREAVEGLAEKIPAEERDRKPYGKVSALYDNGDSIDLTYYADVAGFVPSLGAAPPRSPFSNLEKPDIGNGDLSPEWGVDIRLNGGTLTYGPWADRQRTELQRAFFPPAFFNSEPTRLLLPGDQRLHTALKIYIDFSQPVTFRLPTRETSKDWRYDGNDPSVDSTARPYGWLDMTMGSDSSVSFVLPMIAGVNGFETFLEIHLDSLAIFSSVNYEKFLGAKTCRISCQLPQPLSWSAQHDWRIKVAVERPEIYFLRDHAYLLTDIVRDWTSGEPTEFNQFVPFIYNLDLQFTDYKLYLYLNERNVIDNALSAEDNTLLALTGPRIAVLVDIPSTSYNSAFSNLDAVIEAHNVDLSMSAPASNTHQAWLTDRTAKFGHVERLRTSIRHTVFAQADDDNVETLDIEMEIDDVLFEALGWVVKYLIELKENYFGAYNNFTTSSELQNERNRLRRANELDPEQRRFNLNKPDVFEVNLTLTATNGLALIPEELHDCKSGLALILPAFSVHLRNHDYCMEMLVDCDPIRMTFVKDFTPLVMVRKPPEPAAWNRLLLDGLSISAHRLFGLQPLTSTYVAMWHFGLGRLSGDVTIPHFASLVRIARTFGSNFQDKDNAVPHLSTQNTLPDVTFLTMGLTNCELNVWSGESAVNLAAPRGVAIALDDLIRQGRLLNVHVSIPCVEARGLVPAGTGEEWLEVVSCSGGVNVQMAKSATDWQGKEATQKDFLRKQDSITQRCGSLYGGAQETDEIRAGPVYIAQPQAADARDLFTQHQRFGAIIEQAKSRNNRSRKESIISTKLEGRKGVALSKTNAALTYQALLGLFTLEAPAHHICDGTSAFKLADPAHGSAENADVQSVQARELSPQAYIPVHDNESLTTLDVRLMRKVRLTFSPKGTKVAEDIIESLEKNFEFEHWIDELDILFRKGLPVKTLPDRHETLHASIEIPLLSLTLVQDVLRPGDIDMRPDAYDMGNRDASVLSAAHLLVGETTLSTLVTQQYILADASDPSDGWKIRALPKVQAVGLGVQYETASGLPIRTKITRKTLSASVGPMSLVVTHASPEEGQEKSPIRDNPIPGTKDGTVLDMRVEGLRFHAELPDNKQTICAAIHDIDLRFVASAAELVTGTLHSWLIVSRTIQDAVLNAHYRPVQYYRRLVSDILQAAHREQITTDPLFLNRPTAAAVQLRSGISWKVLAHVRHIMRRLSNESATHIRETFTQAVDAQQDFHAIVSHLQEWHNWELDEPVIRRLAMIRLLFLPEELQNLPKASIDAEADRHSAETNDRTDLQVLLQSRTLRMSYFEGGSCTNSLRQEPCQVFGCQVLLQDPAALLRITMGDLSVSLDPGILRLILHVTRVRAAFENRLARLLQRTDETIKDHHDGDANQHNSVPLQITMLTGLTEVSAWASGIKLHAALQTVHLHAKLDLSFGSSQPVTFTQGSAYGACDTAKLTASIADKPAHHERPKAGKSTLFTVQVDASKGHAVLTKDDPAVQGWHILLSCSLGGVRVRVPRSVLRMTRFLEQWSAESLPESWLAFEELRRDLERAREVLETQPSSLSRNRTARQNDRIKLTVHIAIPVINCHIRAAQKFWLIYTMGDVLTHCGGMLQAGAVQSGSMSLRLASQTMAFHPVAEANAPAHTPQVVPAITDIPLPAVLLALGSDGSAIDITAIFDRIAMTVTADILDKILAVVNRFEQDIDEILAFFVERKRQKAQEVTSQLEKAPRLFPPWTGHLILRGVNVGLRGVLSTQYISADTVEGKLQYGPHDGGLVTEWDINASNLALSLAHDSVSGGDGERNAAGTFERAYRLAYFVLDLKLGNRQSEIVELRELIKQELDTGSEVSHLHVTISKVHAVMQAAAIEALDDLLEHFVTELSNRKKARAAEIWAIREKVISTFDINEKPAAPKVLPWVERCMMSIRLRDIGIAIPLQDIEIAAPLLPHAQSHSSLAPPAFLVSAPEILFATCKGQAGYMKLLDVSAQFVQKFDQNRAHDFTGAHHTTHNRLLLPSSKLAITHDSKTSSSTRAFTVNASMSGALLDLDGTIVDRVFALIDLYEISLRRLARHAPDPVVQGKLSLKEAFGAPESQSAMPEAPSFIESISFEASFSVESGIIRVHGRPPSSRSSTSTAHSRNEREAPDSARLYKTTATQPRQPRRQARVYDMLADGSQSTPSRQLPFDGHQSNDQTIMQPDSFSIPKLTLWALKKDAVSAGMPNDLHVNAIVHQSTNHLRPSLLPFLSDVSDALKLRMQKSASSEPSNAATVQTVQNAHLMLSSKATDADSLAAAARNFSSLQITVSLRIDESKLHFGCGNKIPVSATVDWKSGGILLRVQPGIKRLQATLQVQSLSIDIKHPYSPEDCFKAVLQKTVGSLEMAQLQDGNALLCANLDITAISGTLNIRQLQDFICFKEIWIDRLEQMVPMTEGAVKAEVPVVNNYSASGTTLQTIVLARIRDISVVCIMGHNIGDAEVKATNLIGRLRQMPRHSRSFSADLQRLEVRAKGQLAGHVTMDGLYFENYLHDIVHTQESHLQNCTNISAYIGQTKAMLAISFNVMLIVETEPIRLGVSDDWTRMATESELGLDFSLKLGSITLTASSQTIPRLARIVKDLERLIEERGIRADDLLIKGTGKARSKSTTGKLEIKEAREAWKASAVLPSAIPEGTKVIGKIGLEADTLRLTVFQQNLDDQDAFKADAGAIKAELTRWADSGTVNRDLSLKMASFSVNKVAKRGNSKKSAVALEQNASVAAWVHVPEERQETNIFRFPTSQASMKSEEAEGSNRILHRFSLLFTGKVDLSLNYALLKQLGHILQAYRESMQPEGKTTTSGLGELTASSKDENVIPAVSSNTNDKSTPAKKIQAENIPPPKSIDVVGNREYVALENSIDTPQLQFLGEATPPVEWIGVQRSHAPALIHEACTLMLEKLLLELSTVYRKSLSKAASIS